MKKLILICGLLAFSLTTTAAPSKQSAWQQQKNECEGWAEVAEIVMSARQRGVSIREIYTNMSTLDEETRTLFEMFLSLAYDVPIAPTKEGAQLAVLEFSDQFFKVCMKK
ncbi:hypothetical protein HX127_08335 [Acinetobacter sp. 256-1]|uniref:hypothetical protein n=1 Tax=Acinetobacter sp. 256-1 TaxID=2746721 RepID=UPI002578B944|nr:hypothetical protein [Acinetobacter sp. 256-1]MDM1757579.1 hypothetical protein [Acinetobacter sp. 256-1]